jgi:hypothetical protein
VETNLQSITSKKNETRFLFHHHWLAILSQSKPELVAEAFEAVITSENARAFQELISHFHYQLRRSPKRFHFFIMVKCSDALFTFLISAKFNNYLSDILRISWPDFQYTEAQKLTIERRRLMANEQSLLKRIQEVND